jgi:hypothetical protein
MEPNVVDIIKAMEKEMAPLADDSSYQPSLTHQARFSKGVECILESYRGTFQDTSIYNRALLKKIEDLTEELKESRDNERQLEKKILAYNEQHPSGFINRRHFDTYMLTTRNRVATNDEWHRFVQLFSFDTNPMTLALYKWIDTHIA